MNKAKVKNFFVYHWYWYLVIFAAVFFAFFSLFQNLRTVKYENKVCLFFGATNVESSKLERDLYQGFEDTEIQKISIDFADPKGMYYNVIWSTRGAVDTDIVILDRDQFDEREYTSFFVSLDEGVLNRYVDVSSLNFLNDSEETHYGIYVDPYLENYMDTNGGEYYLFFNKNSPKISSLGENGTNDYALRVLKNLVGLAK